MSPAELEVRSFLTAEQFEEFEKALGVITIPFTNPLAHATIRKVYFSALAAAYSCGRVRGIADTMNLVKHLGEQPEASHERPVG